MSKASMSFNKELKWVANELAIKSMSNSIYLSLNDPTDKFSPKPHLGTDMYREGIMVIPHTTKVRWMLVEYFLKYVEREKDPNGIVIEKDKDETARDPNMRLVFQSREMEAYSNMIAFMLDNGFTKPDSKQEETVIEACVYCRGDAVQNFTGFKHAVVCNDAECIKVIGAMCKI